MRGHSLRIVVMGAAIAIVAIVAPTVGAGAASTAACTKTSGVTVIVDFAYFHHRIARGCAAGRPATALAAMQAAGFETAGTTRYGDAFVCRIDNLPSPKAEACSDTPPARSSWSFYFARPDDATWTYSSAGVLGYRPPAGTIIAFAFGNYARPGVRPADVRPTAAPPTTAAAPPPTAAPTLPTVAAAAATTTTSASAPPTSAARAVSLPTTTSTPSTTTSSTTSARVVDRPQITHLTVKGASGSPRGAVLAVVIVSVLATAALLMIRARRGPLT
jgi:hypothetical protein